MGLRTATPWKHPQIGAYYLRARVPADLVERVKGRKVSVLVQGQPRQVTLGPMGKVSLGTKEPKAAREVYRDTAASVEELWRQLRQKAATAPVRLTGKQTQALAGV